jgi:hypothetical protein
MIRRILLPTLAACLAAAPALAQSDWATAARDLQRFVNRNSASVDSSSRTRVESRISIAALRGCEAQITQHIDVRSLVSALVYRVDMSKLSPVASTRSARSENLTLLEFVTTDGEDLVASTFTIGRRAAVAQGTSWRLSLPLPAEHAQEAGRLFSEVIRLCGGQPASAEALERIAGKRLRAEGNDPETFPLKARCLETVAALLPAGTALPADSSLTVTRSTRQPRVELFGYVPEESGRRRFSCGFRREGDAWLPDGANLARATDTPAPP